MNTAVAVTPPKKDGLIEYVPFGAKDPVKLSVAIIKQYVAVKTRSGKTCDDQQAMKFMMLCLAQRLNPFAGDAFLVGYDKRNQDGSYTPTFSLITAHQAFIKRAEENKDYEGMESGIILINAQDNTVTEREGDFKLPTENVVGGWAKVYRKGRKPTYRRLSIAAMKPAYDTPFWNEDKAPGQICKCAESQALRDTFPTLMGGMFLENEMQSATIDISTSSPSSLVAIADAPTEQAGEEQASQAAKPAGATEDKTITPQAELEELVIKNGFTFDHFTTWAADSGNIADAKSLSNFADIDGKVAARLLKAKTGLLKGLAQAKGTVEG